MKLGRARASLIATLALPVALGGPAAGPPAGAATAGAGASGRSVAGASLLVKLDPARQGPVVSSDFVGLSLETPAVRSPAIVSGDPSLERLLDDLGPGVLRISGDSADRTQWLGSPAPVAPWAVATLAPADIDHLAALMHATGWSLALGLNLGHPRPAAIAEEARTASAALGQSLAGLEIGNEPDLYTRPLPAPFRSSLGASALRPARWGFADYEAEVAQLRGALSAAGVSAPLWGPDTAGSSWLDRYGARAVAGLAVLTAHLYPFDRCVGGQPTRGPSQASLLARAVAQHEARLIHRLAGNAATLGLRLRIDETNSVACGGQRGVSDTFAAALWALDYSLTAASNGAAGINFHGGLGSCSSGGTIVSPWYSPLCSLPDGRLRARPEYYALLLLRSLEGSSFVRADCHTTGNVSVFALRAPDGTLRVVVDDMEPSSSSSKSGHRRATPLRVTLRTPREVGSGSVIRLSAPSIGARSRLTLGGVSLGADGSLPAARAEPIAGGSGRFVVEVDPASAALVTLVR